MSETSIIGVIHNLVPEKDLDEILNKIKPNLILVEADETELTEENKNNLPLEIQYLVNWSKKHNTKLHGVGTVRNILIDPEPSDQEMEKVTSTQLNIIKGISWKDVNQSSIAKKMMEAAKSVIDWDFHLERQEIMLRKIEFFLCNDYKILIALGAAHLDFFEKRIPNVKLPFRYPVS